MKKILVLFLLLFAVQVQAAGIYTTVARGTVTQANMKISAVDGTAFVDFGAANVLTTKLGHLLKIRDSSGRAIQGFIKAAGTGETLGSDIVTDGGFADAGQWTATNGFSVTGGKCVKNGGTGYKLSQEKTLISLALYKATFTIDTISNGVIGAVLSLPGIETIVMGGSYHNTTGSKSGYGVPRQSNSIAIGTSIASSIANVDDLAIKQVLTPSATGVTIVSSKGGTTYNWAQKNSSFNYNDSSGYTYEIIQVRQLPVIATHSITAGNALIDTTEANAFAAPVGVDLSAYQDGRHMLALYDASGYAAIAWISATAPGGEVLSSETHTSANAASDPNSNEANATTGWATTGTLLESTGADKSVGSYSLHTVFGSAGKTVGTTPGSFASVVGAVYLCTFDAKKVNNPAVILVNGSGVYVKPVSTTTSWASYSSYFTNNSGIYGYAGLYSFSNSSSDEVYIDNYSRKRLTTPAATGVLLLSSKGGSRGWLYKHASFNPNSAITAKILYVGD